MTDSATDALAGAAEAEAETRPPAPLWRRLLPLAVIAGGAATGWWLLGDRLSFQTLADNREALIAWRESNWLVAALTYVAVYVAVVAFSLPGAVWMTLAGGFLFGVVAGGLLTVVAATVGATLIFLAAKTGIGDRLAASLDARGGMMARFRKGVEANQVSFLLLMRLVPAVPFFVANLAPAFLGVGLPVFVATTFFGIMPGTFVFAWVGDGLGAVFDQGGRPDLGLIFEPQVIGPILALCALAALPMILKALKRKEG